MPDLKSEKARLEAFLSAVPGEYCGWARDGSVAYSAGLCGLLSIPAVESINDILSALNTSDASALEGVFNRLQDEGTPFTMKVENSSRTRNFRISASRGYDLERKDSFDILWFEDITAQITDHQKAMQKYEEQSLQLSLFEKAFNHFLWPVWIRDQDQKLIWVNTRYAEFMDSNFSTVIEEQKDLIPENAKSKALKQDYMSSSDIALKAYNQGGEAVFHQTHINKSGKRMLMNIVETFLEGHDATIGIAQDLSSLETLEKELKRNQKSNAELLEYLTSAIVIFDREERAEFYNSAFSELWQLEAGWLNKKPKLGEIMEKLRETRRLPEQADFREFKQSWLDMFTSLIDPHEDLLHLPDGSTLRMLVVPHSMGGLMMTFEDVSSRLELESSYNTLVAVQRETLDNLAESVAVFGGDGRLKLCNPAYGRLWDLNPEDLDGEPHISRIVEKLKKFFDEKSWPERKEELHGKALDRIMHEGRIQRQDDKEIDYTTVPLPDGGVLVTYSDVTDSVQFENALREKNSALETAERVKLDFLANVSYQLRTPLNAIMGFNDILDKEYFGPLNARQKEYTHDMREASSRLLELINDILDLSTIEAGHFALQKENIELTMMLEGLIELIAPWANKERVKVELTCPKTIGKLYADESRLKQALINLLRNSITFTPSGGLIQVKASRKKDGIQIIVADNGVGIDRENQLRIFSPFEKAQSGQQNLSNQLSSPSQASEQHQKTGAGLGLTLVKNLIELHKGSVELESEIGKGTIVRLFIPFDKKSEKSSGTKMKKPLNLSKKSV